MKTRALITGISGQDGSYLAELLLEKDYEVLGVIRRSAKSEHELGNATHIVDHNLHIEYGDLLDISSIERILLSFKPHDIYNLASQSHVRISFDNPIYTSQVTGMGVLNMLEAFRNITPYAHFYQASSSEMFGNNIEKDGFQRETTPFHPASPYACAKTFAHNICRNYRVSYNLFIACGILFNHESPRRGENFVTAKIAKAAARIKKGKQEYVELGNLDSCRDWGHAKDYVEGMWRILQWDVPEDFVLATGETHSVEDFCKAAFDHVGLNYKDYIKQNKKFMRPEEVRYLIGDATKAKTILKWKPEYTFDALVAEMVDHWYGE